LPGDDLMPRADLTATRAITVHAAPERVWPWLAQLGQGRGGFYTYDFLENLVGLDMHSADKIIPEWQDIEVGDEVRLYPKGGMVAEVVQPDRALVLRGGMPLGAASAPFDFSWAFVSPEGRTKPRGSWSASGTRTSSGGQSVPLTPPRPAVMAQPAPQPPSCADGRKTSPRQMRERGPSALMGGALRRKHWG